MFLHFISVQNNIEFVQSVCRTCTFTCRQTQGGNLRCKLRSLPMYMRNLKQAFCFKQEKLNKSDLLLKRKTAEICKLEGDKLCSKRRKRKRKNFLREANTLYLTVRSPLFQRLSSLDRATFAQPSGADGEQLSPDPAPHLLSAQSLRLSLYLDLSLYPQASSITYWASSAGAVMSPPSR